jgi:hypothetical protein
MYNMGTTFTTKINSNDKIVCENIANIQSTNVLKWLKLTLGSAFTYNCNFVVCLSYPIITLFHICRL